MAKEHPMIFNADMVLAIMRGDKTMTRRPITAANSLLNGEGVGRRGLNRRLGRQRLGVGIPVQAREG